MIRKQRQFIQQNQYSLLPQFQIFICYQSQLALQKIQYQSKMLTYSDCKYLKSIPLSDVPEHLRFINLFHMEPGSPTRKKSEDAIKEVAMYQIGTRVFQLLSQTQITQQKQYLLIRMSEMCEDHPQQFLILLRKYPTTPIQIANTILQTVINSAILIQPHPLQQYLLILSIMKQFFSTPTIFQTFIGLTSLWLEKSYTFSKGHFDNQFYKTLVQNLAIIEDKFTIVTEQFLRTRKILWVSAVFFIEAHQNESMIEFSELENLENRREASSEILEYPVNHFKLERVMSEIDEQPLIEEVEKYYEKYLEIVKKYCYIDPQYHKKVLENIVCLMRVCSSKRHIKKRVSKYFGIVAHFLKQRIFENYEEIVLSTLKYLAKTKNQLVKQFLAQITSFNSTFLSAHINDFKTLYSYKTLNTEVFRILHESLKQTDSPCQQCTKLLVSWNLQSCYINSKQLIELLSQKKFDSLSKEAEALIAQSRSKMAGEILEQMLRTKVEAYSPQKRHLNKQFIKEEVLSQNQRPYIVYTSMLIKVITNPPIDLEQINLNDISSVGVSSNMEKMEQVRECTKFLLKTASANSVIDLEFFEQLLFLCSLIEGSEIFCFEDVEDYMFSILYSIPDEILSKLLQRALKKLMMIGSKLSLFISLVVILKYSDLKNQETAEIIIEKALKNIELQLLNNQYSRIVSYSSYSLKLLLILFQRVTNENSIKLIGSIISQYSISFSKYEIELVLYYYDQQYYSQIAKRFQFQRPSVLTVKEAFDRNLFLLERIIEHQFKEEPFLRKNMLSMKFVNPFRNQLEIMPIRIKSHQNKEPPLFKIQFYLIANWRTNKHSCFEFYSMNKMGVFRHRLYFKNGSIFFCDKISKRLISEFQIPQESCKHFAMKIQIGRQVFRVYVDGKEIIRTDFHNELENIKCELNGDLLIGGFSWTASTKIRKIGKKFSYRIYPEQAEIRLKSSLGFQIQSFNKKFTTSLLCAYLKKILSVNPKLFHNTQFAQISFRLILKNIDLFQNSDSLTKSEINKSCSLIHYLFKQIYDGTESIEALPDYSLPLSTANMRKLMTSKIYFTILLAGVFNEDYFMKIHHNLRMIIIQFMVELIQKDREFMQLNENRRMGIFVKIFAICEKLTEGESESSQLISKLLSLAQHIVFTHLSNKVLLEKIKFIFYYSKQSALPQILHSIKDTFNIFFSSACDQLPEQGNSVLKKSSSYVLSELQELPLILSTLNFQIQTKVLDFLLLKEGCLGKCEQFFNELDDDEILKFSDWVVCSFKHYNFEYFTCMRENDHNLNTIIFLLHCLKKVRSLKSNEDPAEQEIFMKLQKDFLTKIYKLDIEVIGKIFNSPDKSDILDCLLYQLQLTHSYQGTQKLSTNWKYYKNNLELLELWFSIIFKLPKLQLLKLTTLIRKKLIHKIQAIRTIFMLKCIYHLEPFALSIFLQLIFEFLVIVQQNFLPESIEYQKVGQIITQYLHQLLFSKTKASKAVIQNHELYVFPIMIDQYSENLEETLKKMKEKQFNQLTGGIYFKLLCITSKLIQMYHRRNYSDFIKFLLQPVGKKKEKIGKQKLALFRAISDFNQVKKEVKERHEVQLAIKEQEEQHSQYYLHHDLEIQSRKVQKSIKESIKEKHLSPTNKDAKIIASYKLNDLTPFFVDYFLMKLCYFLQSNCQVHTKQSGEVNKAYSQLFVKYLHQFDHIYEEMDEKNTRDSNMFECVDDLYTFEKERQSEQFITDLLINPTSPSHSVFKQDPFKSYDENFLSPKKRNLRQTLFEGKSSSKKRRAQLVKNLERDIHMWGVEAKQKKLHLYFRNESKRILMKEVLHSYYTLQNCRSQNKQVFEQKKKKLQKFLNEYDATFIFTTFSEKNLKNFNEMIRKMDIRKIFPFTSPEMPVFKLKEHGFINQLTPFVKLSKIGDYPQRIDQSNKNSVVDQQYLAMLEGTFITGDEKIRKVSDSDEVFCVLETQEIKNEENLCEISMRSGVYFCQLTDDEVGLFLKCRKQKKSENLEMSELLKRGVPQADIKFVEGKKIKINFDRVKQIFVRKYNQIRESALEFFMRNGESYVLILYSKNRVQLMLERWSKMYVKFEKISIIRDFKGQFEKKGYTEKWRNGQMSNFDYLMKINKYSGRSVADLSQYYIFPWILDDYSSKQINLNDPSIFRDLKKPIGALNPEKLKKYRSKLANASISSEAGTVDRYLYGSHYSTSLFILYFLVRIEPFTSLHRQMQSGMFDSPDRIFSSMQIMWESLLSQSNTSDIKESIPEFYYQSTFLKNVNNIELGTKQDGIRVDDVELPPWASNSAQRFINIMRAALQSDYVSLNINYWIDLIFGKDQNSFDKDNVYYPLSYLENIDESKIEPHKLEATMSQIYYFGQNSHVLFDKQHPYKKTKLGSQIYSRDLRMNQESEILEKSIYVSQMERNGKEITLELAHINKISSHNIRITLDMSEKSPHTLIRKIQNHNAKMQRIRSLNYILLPEEDAAQTIARVDENTNQIQILNKSDKLQELIYKFNVDFKFSKVAINPVYFVCFGGFGLQVYDWTLKQILTLRNGESEISDCKIYESHFFYLTSTGILLVYDWVSGTSRQITRIRQKNTKTAQMEVYLQNSLPNKKSTTKYLNYKFVLIGDRRHIVILYYSLKVG